MFDIAKAWLLARWAERTSWNGVWLIGIGAVVLLGAPFIKVAAWAAIGYGAWQIWKKESQD